MNKILTSVFILVVGLLIWASCGKDVESGLQFSAYDYATLDLNGGDWKPYLLTSPTQIAVPTATASTDAAYTAEIAAMKNLRNNATDAQKAAVQYWGANGVARWNEIISEILAKYNLPPVANADGTYPVPNSMTPDVYPYFPFANPPYAARAYAYLSAATFDALIACWNAKRANNRLAPYKYDATVDPLLPKNDLPSYPSEDAVVAAVSRTILSAMFPVEKANIATLAAEHENSRLWAGCNVTSDISAGDSLGTAVAKLFLARAKSDKMGVANNQTVIDSTRKAVEATGEVSWHSLETPARPPMLPTYGNVKPWLIPSAAALRPGPPPSTNSQKFKDELAEVKRTVENLTTEQRRIATFWSDGPSTYTPPGHWNRIGCDLIVKNKFNPLRSARAFAYLNMAMADGGIVCWHTKYYYFNPRPSDADKSIKTFIGLPNFPAYISGHSTFSSAGAEVLGHIFPSEAANLTATAKEASESRIYGGIHYRSDCETGLTVGKAVAAFTIEKARTDGAE